MAKMGRPISDDAKRKVLTIRISSETFEQLKEYANTNQQTMTEVVLQCLKEFLSRHK